MRHSQHSLGIVVLVVAACGNGGGQPDGPIVIDAVSIDGPPPICNLLTQSGCNVGEKCTWIRVSAGPSDAEQLGQVGCAPDGAAALDAACSYGASGATTGFDNCMGGLICLASPATEMASGTCKSMCSLADATLTCATGFACGAYSKFFSNTETDTPLAGVCEPTCNVLSQVRDSDGAPNCGADPMLTVPDRGCYGFPSQTAAPTTFSCTGAGDLGHREVVPPPPYLNSCLPGAIPLLRESSGAMQVVCIAPCQPETINSVTFAADPDVRDGAEPYSCPQMPVAIGIMNPARATGAGERCQHLWFWEGSVTPVTAPSNGVGFCVDFTRYTWDHDGMPATPPENWTLPETTMPCANINDATTWQPTEDCFWGTTPLPLTAAPLPQPPRRASDLGFQPLPTQRSAP
jgi:hypothetical protein